MIFLRSFYIPLLCALQIVPSCITEAAGNDNRSAPLCFPVEDLHHSNEKLRSGDEFFEAALYTRAIDAYKSLIEEISNKKEQNTENLHLLMLARFRLAEAYFSLEQYRDALPLLKENIALVPETLSSKLEQIRRYSLYLYASGLKNLEEYPQSKIAFASYIGSPIPPPLPLYEEALFETGLIDFLQQAYPQSYQAFYAIRESEQKRRLFFLANLYMARIQKHLGHHHEASRILDNLNAKLSKNDPLFFELNYLQGEVAFETKDYAAAIEHFKKTLPKKTLQKEKWYPDALYHLGWSYLRMGDEAVNDPFQQREYLQNAEEIFDKLTAISPEENSSLALAQCYLSQAKNLKLPEYYEKAEKLLSQSEVFVSQEAKAHALLLRAEAAPSYSARDQIYKQLTEGTNDRGIYYAKGWYMRALNDFEQAMTLRETENNGAGRNAFNRSAESFEKAFELLQENDKQTAAASLKYKALATSFSDEPKALSKAFRILDDLMQAKPGIWEAAQNQDEILYLHGYFAGRIAQKENKEKNLDIASKSLQAAASIPNNTFGAQALNYLGSLHYTNENYKDAESVYLQLTAKYPHSPLAAEAWNWMACCADRLNEGSNIGKERRQYTYENFPDSPYAAEAFFSFYSYPEYLQGDRTAIKHLQNFTDRYVNSPFLIDAHFLIGLDYKRDRKTSGGRWIRRKSLTDAIDSFQKSEILFDDLAEKKLIPADKLDYYTAMRYRATLERAKINLAIADEAQGAKKQIYLDYAEEVFKNLLQELKAKKNPYVQRLYHDSPFPTIEEESSYWLAQTYIKSDKDGEAERILSEIAEQHKKSGTDKGYYLAKTFDERGRIAMRKQDFTGALQLFKKAEDAAKGGVLSTDQKLDLWIQQSLCCRGLNQFDDAVLILSRVINDDAISALRVKAMYLRAETYELQKRPELARKQLESMVKKGGVWARKAKEKLEKDDLNYGH